MSQNSSAPRAALSRRTDLQSLRALAILIVVAAHAHIPGMQGGYVGVDVFFVLSGFLISGLILHEVETTRRFNAWAFYARRLKRLLPALLVVLLLVSATAWLLASPLQQREDAAAGQAAALWLSNFYFSARIINYFSAGLGGNLFLHTWSLAVEEQFYLIWPWMLLFLLGVWSWQGAPFSRKRLAIGLAFLAVASLLLGAYWSNTAVEAGFYLMPGRMWEFALGALIFLLRQALDHPPPQLNTLIC
ncbi:MAG: acyltransferase [Thiomonas sp.]|nr:acyltransferase [Thiomonas sp.]